MAMVMDIQMFILPNTQSPPEAVRWKKSGRVVVKKYVIFELTWFLHGTGISEALSGRFPAFFLL